MLFCYLFIVFCVKVFIIGDVILFVFIICWLSILEIDNVFDFFLKCLGDMFFDFVRMFFWLVFVFRLFILNLIFVVFRGFFDNVIVVVIFLNVFWVDFNWKFCRGFRVIWELIIVL